MRSIAGIRSAPAALACALFAAICVTYSPALRAKTWCVQFSGGECEETTQTIQAAVGAATAGDTIKVAAGTYNEWVVLPTRLTLLGAQVSRDPRSPRGDETIIRPGSVGNQPNLMLLPGSAGSRIDGFTIAGGFFGIHAAHQPDQPDANVDGLQVVNNRIIEFAGSGIILGLHGANVTIDRNVIDGSMMTLDTPMVSVRKDRRFDGLWLTNNDIGNATNPSASRAIAFLANGNRQIGKIADRTPLMRGNTFSAVWAGMVIENAVEYAEISGNTFRGNRCVALQGAPANTLIANNTFIDNMSGAIALGLPLPTSAPADPSQWGAHHNEITGNLIFGNGNASLWEKVE